MLSVSLANKMTVTKGSINKVFACLIICSQTRDDMLDMSIVNAQPHIKPQAVPPSQSAPLSSSEPFNNHTPTALNQNEDRHHTYKAYKMRRLTQILNQSKKFVRESRKEKDTIEAQIQDPPLPSLPNTPILLSPTHPQTGFFSLPFEVREIILTEAFRYVRIHIDLQLLPPRHEVIVPDGCPGSYGSPNLPLHRHLYQWDSPIRCWKWYGCFCCLLQNTLTEEYGVLPHHDLCRFEDELCPSRRTSVPCQCRLGIMGFMMSCKQA